MEECEAFEATEGYAWTSGALDIYANITHGERAAEFARLVAASLKAGVAYGASSSSSSSSSSSLNGVTATRHGVVNSYNEEVCIVSQLLLDLEACFLSLSGVLLNLPLFELTRKK